MEIVWTVSARQDLRSHVLHVAERNPTAARKLRDSVRQSVEGLANFPHRGRPGRVEGTRELVIVGTPYLVVYRVRSTSVRILRVLHGAQEWPPSHP